MAKRVAVERFAGSATGSPAVVMVGRSVLRRAGPGLRPHEHGCWELCLIESGEAAWFQGEQDYAMRPGMCFVTPPGLRHGARHGVREPIGLRWVQVEPAELAERQWAEKLVAIGPAAFALPTPQRWMDVHDRLLGEARRERDDGLTRPTVDAALTLLLTETLRAADSGTFDEHDPAFATLLRFIEGRAGQRLMVEDLELFTGLGRSRVHQLFRRHVGQSPGAYLLHRRLRVAADRLRETGDDVTDIALDLEFASSQHLATAFRRRYGLSPTAFRAAAM